VARLRKELEAEFFTAMSDDRERPDASIVPLFGQPRHGESDLQALRRMIAELESRLVESEQRTMERLEGLERHLETVEVQLESIRQEAVDRARTLERSMVKLADRIRGLEPR
jgi:predicted  nucleic acid-binding Zn-ribbon protein